MGNLTEKGSFTIHMFLNDSEAKKFHNWFKLSSFTSDFSFEITTDMDGDEILEITAHNPLFTTDALQQVYLCESTISTSKVNNG